MTLIADFPINSNALKDLLTLNKLKQNTEVSYHTCAIRSPDRGKAYTSFMDVIEQHLVHPFSILIQFPYKVSRSDRPDWSAKIKQDMEELKENYNVEFLETMSSVLTDRSNAVLMYKINNTYVSFKSSVLSSSDIYTQHLAFMLHCYKDDEDFVRRAAEAIQKKTLLPFNDTEEKLLKQYQQEEQLLHIQNSIVELMKQERPTHRIEDTKNFIRELEQRLANERIKLRDLLRLDHAILTDTAESNEQLNELMEYIKDTGGVLQTEHSNGNIYFTVSSYMYISEDSATYFNNLDSDRHPLHRHPQTTQLLRDVMEQKLRVPIFANFRIVKDNGRYAHTYGVSDYATPTFNVRNYIENKHITRYNCFDGYRNQISQALLNSELISVIEIMKTATASINLFDSSVMPYILESIQQLLPDTPVEIRTNDGWNKIRLEDYYASIKSEHESTEATDS